MSPASVVARVSVGPRVPTAAARRALLARGGSGVQGPGRWAAECGESGRAGLWIPSSRAR